MTSRRLVPLVSIALAVLALDTGSLAQQTALPRDGVIRNDVRAVLVDVVVRDRRGQPVRDLSPADFAILEDGVPQTIGSFSAMFEPSVDKSAAVAVAPAPTAVVGALPSPAPRGPGITALVFDRLPIEARRTAAEAARSYLGSKEETKDFIAVYGIDLTLSVFVPFTRNGTALSQALDAMLNQATSNPAARNTALLPLPRPVSGATASPAAGNSPDALLQKMQDDMLKDFATMEQAQQGYATTDALFAILSTLGRIPGRKSVVLFSEGISTPDQVHHRYLGVIDAANRANVSIYTLDAAGLRAEGDQANVRRTVNEAAAAGLSSYAGDGVSEPFLRNLEHNSAGLRSDPTYSLGVLASSTGGLFFHNTNNLRPAFERIESDLRNYYLLGYTPSEASFDGHFRKIDVTVKRPGVTIAARKGYFAVRDPGGSPINAWESGALGALEQQPAGNAFPVRAGALLFPERGRPGLVPIVVHLQTAPLTFRPDADGKSYSSDFTILVRFVDRTDPQPRVVKKMSQHYEIRGPLSGIERARQGDVIFYRESELPPGLYTMETVVFDAPSRKSSVRLSTVEVPGRDVPQLRASSLVLVTSTEAISEKDRIPGQPLVIEDRMILPNLGEPVRKAARDLGFYFAVYPAEGGPATESTIELCQNGLAVARMPMAIPPKAVNGRIQQVGRVPIGDLAPGTYELRAVVTQGQDHVVRSSLLRIVE